jgi:hypothetical protein
MSHTPCHHYHHYHHHRHHHHRTTITITITTTHHHICLSYPALTLQSHQRPRNEEAIREKMISMMKKAHFVPTGQTPSKPNYSTDTMLLFDEFVDMAMMKDALPKLEGDLKVS